MRSESADVSHIWSMGSTGPAPYDLRELFGNDHPVELEVGSGKGLFLAREGQQRPDVNLLGIEWSVKFARLAAARVARRGLPNVRILSADAREIISLFADGAFQAVHVYFPDPWWKRRHRKRRVFTPEFIAQVARVLGPGGILSFATDVEEYFQVMLRVMRGCASFSAADPSEPNAPQHDLDYLTHFERKYRQEGRTIHRARYLRVAAL